MPSSQLLHGANNYDNYNFKSETKSPRAKYSVRYVQKRDSVQTVAEMVDTSPTQQRLAVPGAPGP